MRVELVQRIADVAAAAWDACANPDPATFNPFVAHAFLRRWRMPARWAGAPAGRRGIWC